MGPGGLKLLWRVHVRSRVPRMIIQRVPGSPGKGFIRIPHAKLIKVAGGSHAFFMEMRHRFKQEILDFLGMD